MAERSAPRVPVEERLFSLVLALLATEGGLTKNEILSSVQGYRQRYSRGGDNASLERQFERDKDDIRELGVPLETLESPETSGNNQLLRYRIRKGAYDLPADIRFSGREIALLGLAGAVWREGSLSGESRRAMMKLRSLGIEPDGPVLGFAPRLRARDASFEPLSAALDRHQVVQFPYLKPGETQARTRTVLPLALVQFDGRWHLRSLDLDANAERTFLLSRVVGRVRTTARKAPHPEGQHASRALEDLERLHRSQEAEIEVRPGSEAESRLGNRGGTDGVGDGVLRLHYLDLDVLADELAGYGPEVLVRSPEALMRAVRTRLEAVLAAHDDGEGPNDG